MPAAQTAPRIETLTMRNELPAPGDSPERPEAFVPFGGGVGIVPLADGVGSPVALTVDPASDMSSGPSAKESERDSLLSSCPGFTFSRAATDPMPVRHVSRTTRGTIFIMRPLDIDGSSLHPSISIQ
ncbi:MAG TPA: hypothetical protein HA263_10225 [Methanoregulaceae archaeon]|nr:hypothetical protein [Methanoregulaceae archaeon]